MFGLFSYLASRRRVPIVDAKRELPKPAPITLNISFQPLQRYRQTEEDVEFERLLRKCCNGPLEKLFYAKVVGVTFPNADGSRRLQVIQECAIGEALQLMHHTEIAGYPDAVGVHRVGGGQLGYLESRLAGEVLRDEGGKRWVAVFRRPLQHPETGRLAGAVLCMIRLGPNPSK